MYLRSINDTRRVSFLSKSDLYCCDYMKKWSTSILFVTKLVSFRFQKFHRQHFFKHGILKRLQQFLNYRMFSAYIRKVFKKIERGSLDLIPSPIPSVKIQIMGRKICLRCKSKTLLGVVNKLFIFKSVLTSPSNACFALLPQVNFPTNIFNFH